MSQEEKLRKDMPKQEKNPKTYTQYTSRYIVFSLVFCVFLYLKATLYQQKFTVILALTLKGQQRAPGNFAKLYLSNFTHNMKATHSAQMTDWYVSYLAVELRFTK